MQELHDMIMSTWTKFSKNCLGDNVDYMPQRFEAVLRVNGGPTQYYWVPNKVLVKSIFQKGFFFNETDFN